MFGVGKKIKDCMYKYLLEWIGFNADESQDYHDSKTKPSIISLNLHFADGEPENSLPLQYLIRFSTKYNQQVAVTANCVTPFPLPFTVDFGDQICWLYSMQWQLELTYKQ